MNKQQAIEFCESGKWEKLTDEERAALQLSEKFLCMPFDVFHKSIEEALGRPVWTHEFAFADRLRDEFNGLADRPTMEEIISLIPQEKLIIVGQ